MNFSLRENNEIDKRDKKVKLLMLVLQRRGDSNIVGKLPRRVLIYLLSFLARARIVKSNQLKRSCPNTKVFQLNSKKSK